MEPNALVECAYELMGSLKEELAERGTVAPAFILLYDRDCEVLTFSPRLFASAEGKAAVARAFRNRARQTGAHGALMGARQQLLHPRPHRDARGESTTGTGRRRRRHRCAHPIGLRKTSAGLSVTLQTPAFHLLVQQLYARGDNSIVFGELRTLDSREVPMEAAGLFSIYGGQHVTPR